MNSLRRRTPSRVGAVALVLALSVAACGGGASTATSVRNVNAGQAAEIVANPPAGLVVLDVRTPQEFAAGHLAGAINLDFYSPQFNADLSKLDTSVPYLVYCRSGNRSRQAVEQMKQLGFTTVYDLSGGILAWNQAGLPVTP